MKTGNNAELKLFYFILFYLLFICLLFLFVFLYVFFSIVKILQWAHYLFLIYISSLPFVPFFSVIYLFEPPTEPDCSHIGLGGQFPDCCNGSDFLHENEAIKLSPMSSPCVMPVFAQWE